MSRSILYLPWSKNIKMLPIRRQHDTQYTGGIMTNFTYNYMYIIRVFVYTSRATKSTDNKFIYKGQFTAPGWCFDIRFYKLNQPYNACLH